MADLIYPRRCPVCDEALPPGSGRGMSIHPSCYARLVRTGPVFCMKCGKGLQDPLAELCPDCRRFRHSFVSGRSLWRYDSASASAIYALKYRRQPEHARLFARCLAAEYGRWALELRPDWIVPVPVSRSRLIERGYNQAELIASLFGEIVGIPVCSDGLLRVKTTNPQKELGRAGRLRNLEKAFLARPEYFFRGRSVLLIDDVYTTGATIECCTRALHRAGAGRVWFLTLCAGVQ